MRAHYKRRVRRRGRINSTKLIINTVLVLFIVIIASSVSFLAYCKVLNSKALNSFTTIYSSNLNGSSLTLNETEFSITSPIISIREVSNSENIVEKFLGSKSSTAGELLKAVNSGKVNFSKVGNLVLYERTSEDYCLYSSSSLKIRYSNLNDGYLLEVNNKTNKRIEVYYSKSGEVSPSMNEGFESLNLKSGLTQIFMSSDVSIDVLSRNLAKYKN